MWHVVRQGRKRNERRPTRRLDCSGRASCCARRRRRSTCGRCTAPDQSVNDAPYRERWAHDKVVRSTHGVNCTGSCSWKVYVKDGLITWETQQTDYPSVGPDRPEYEPRGCPRGASFSWYTYSPTRVRYPHGPRRPGGAVPGGQGAARGPGGGLGGGHRGSRAAAALPVGARQGRPGADRLGRGAGDRGRRPGAHHQGPTVPTGSPGSRRSPRCRWPRTPPAPATTR